MNRPRKKLNIFIADADEKVRRDIRKILEQRREWKVCGEATTGVEAIDRARRLRPDVLFLDLTLPDLDAEAAIPEIKEVCPTVRIVALARHDSGELAMKALVAGASGLAMKSDTLNDLRLTMQNIAKDRHFLSTAAKRYVKRYVAKEMKDLIRQRNDIDLTISDFERLAGQLSAKSEESRPASGPKSKNLIQMNRSSHRRKH